MKKFLVLLTAALMVFAMVGCEEDVEESPLVGSWTLTDMENDVYATLTDSVSMGMMGWLVPGDVIADDTLDWAYFDTNGVSIDVAMDEDNTFTATGMLVTPSDTMFRDLISIPVNESGTWESNDDNTTIAIVGTVINIPAGSSLSLDDAENPSVITISYEKESDIVTVMPLFSGEPGGTDLPMHLLEKYTLKFTKQ
ncbi:hypothetical protein KAJ27_18060 [bacterium]|nr:hypothetical protein [bacterium]